jgi:hypothetical protein
MRPSILSVRKFPFLRCPHEVRAPDRLEQLQILDEVLLLNRRESERTDPVAVRHDVRERCCTAGAATVRAEGSDRPASPDSLVARSIPIICMPTPTTHPAEICSAMR